MSRHRGGRCVPLIALLFLEGWQTHAQTEGVPDMLRVSDFTGSEYLFVGENYRYFNLLSHKDYQLNALMGPSSDRKRIAERNLILTPDCGIVELTLQHAGKLEQQTTVQLRAIYANSFSTRINGDYLVPPAVERNGLRVVPGFAEQDKYDGRTGGVGIPAGRQAVTVTTPLFTLWVWSGLPEWPAHPARVPEAYPSLHLCIVLPQMPEGQVHGLLGGSLKRVNTTRPLIASMTAGVSPLHLWSAFRPESAGTGEHLKLIDGKEADYRVTGPLANDFPWNAFEGSAQLQDAAAYGARMARLQAVGSVLGF